MKPNRSSPRCDASRTGLTRRELLKAGAAGAAATLLAPTPTLLARAPYVFASGSDVLRVGIVGCGGRGTGAGRDCLKAAAGVRIVALGDLFQDRLDEARAKLIEFAEKRVAEGAESRPADAAAADPHAASTHPAAASDADPASQPASAPAEPSPAARDLVDVPPERCFTGFDAFEKVIAAGVDVVILATPPGFRPPHFEAAVAAGKHVFMEKPVAVDPVGVRRVMAASEHAQEKGLAVVAGTQRRHQPSYVETMRRIHDGVIGEIVAAQCYWNQGELWVKKPKAEWSGMEWQCRNWLYFLWLSGDHIVEQHIHNLDVINWALGGPPAKAVGMGGRQARTGPEFGNVWDHFAVEFEYANGVRVLSMCRQIPGTSERVTERLVGTKGTCKPDGEIRGETEYRYEAPDPAIDPYVQEHRDLIEGIRSGAPLNEGRRVAESTLTAILGRTSAYTGREVSWNWLLNSSQLDLTPPRYEFGEVPLTPVPVPGHTRLV